MCWDFNEFDEGWNVDVKGIYEHYLQFWKTIYLNHEEIQKAELEFPEKKILKQADVQCCYCSYSLGELNFHFSIIYRKVN